LKAERKVQREADRALVQQQKETFEADMAKMDRDKVWLEEQSIAWPHGVHLYLI